jgi:hypothetical protein
MRNLSFYLIVILALGACNSKENQSKVDTTEENTIVPALKESQIPEPVKKTTSKLEENGLEIQIISNSKWNIFGEAGIWLKTDLGIVDIVPIPERIDPTKLIVEEIDSDTPDFYVYELRYMGDLEQILQGHQTYFTIGENLIYKTFSKELNEEIRTVEFR